MVGKILKRSKYVELSSKAARSDRLEALIEFVAQTKPKHLEESLKTGLKSEAQLFQDLFALDETNFKQNGYFVEFGATNGKSLSNSYVLEKYFGWNGILSEPARTWHADLLKNRNVNIDMRCVWSSSGESIEFREVKKSPQISTIDAFTNDDMHAKKRHNSITYAVETISLFDLLKHYDAPKEIDYLSIDTEGTEFEILKNFNFDKYKIRVITVEHNHTKNQQKLRSLLTNNGYKEMYSKWSDFDSWYVLTS